MTKAQKKAERRKKRAIVKKAAELKPQDALSTTLDAAATTPKPIKDKTEAQIATASLKRPAAQVINTPLVSPSIQQAAPKRSLISLIRTNPLTALISTILFVPLLADVSVQQVANMWPGPIISTYFDAYTNVRQGCVYYRATFESKTSLKSFDVRLQVPNDITSTVADPSVTKTLNDNSESGASSFVSFSNSATNRCQVTSTYGGHDRNLIVSPQGSREVDISHVQTSGRYVAEIYVGTTTSPPKAEPFSGGDVGELVGPSGSYEYEIFSHLVKKDIPFPKHPGVL